MDDQTRDTPRHRKSPRGSTALLPTAAPGPGVPAGARAPGQSTQNAILEAAIRLFCRNGIAATGIDAIVAQSGVARMTLYNQFGTKDGLVVAALELEGATWRAWFFGYLARISGPPRARLLAIFDALEEWFDRDDYFGCALMTAAVEHRNQNAAILTVLLAHKRQVNEQVIALCHAAGAPDPAGLAKQIDLLVDGAIVKSLIVKGSGPARDGRKICEMLLSTLEG